MKLAFLVAAHAHPGLLVRLVRRLQSPATSIFIHIDRRADIRPFDSAFRSTDMTGVHRVPCVRSEWGSFGQVRASLTLLRDALERDLEAERFILLSGQDYPLMPPDGMAAFFEDKKGTEFFKFNPLPWAAWSGRGGLDRLEHYHFSMGRYSFTFPSETPPRSRAVRAAYRACELLLPRERSLPDNITFYGGSSWWNLTRDSAGIIFPFLRSNPAFARRFRCTKSPDEIFFQTLLLNSPSPPIVESDDLRCVFWDGRRNEFPASLRMEDFEEIAASGRLFARKVHPRHSLPLLDRIDHELIES